MTHNEEIVYFGRSSTKVCAELLCLYDRDEVERMARHQIRTYAFGCQPHNAALIAFWAGVLGQCRTLRIPEEWSLTNERIAQFESLYERSKPQVICAES